MGTPRNKAMKLLLVLALAATANAHWTHDESLAREIGPPPGEEDVDVSALSDELISEAEKTGEKAKAQNDEIGDKRFRITFGTMYYENIPAGHIEPALSQWKNGASNSQFQVSLKGEQEKTKSSGAEKFTNPSTIEYYVGPAMTYAMAPKQAPQLHPGMVPLVPTDTMSCAGFQSTGILKNCADCTDCGGVNAPDKMTRCEPNTKMCIAMLADRATGAYAVGQVGYAPAKPISVAATDPTTTTPMKMGLIQRGQIYGRDVGQITEVTITEQDMIAGNGANIEKCAGIAPPNDNEDWKCSDPWFPSFAKISTNDPKTGIGNGIYYIHPQVGQFIGKLKQSLPGTGLDEGKLVAKAEALENAAWTGDPHNAQIKKCVAQVCEEEMDAFYGMSEMTEEFLG